MGRRLSYFARRRATMSRGVSLPELIVVIAILALAVIVTVPMIADRVHQAKLRSAASQYAVSLRAARMIAVSKQTTVTVTVHRNPDNRYEYVDATGELHFMATVPDAVSNLTYGLRAFKFGKLGNVVQSEESFVIIQ